MSIKNYSKTASENGAVYFEEGMSPADVNNDARAVMADIRSFYESPMFRDFGHTPVFVSGTSFNVSDDQTAFYKVGQRIEAYGNVLGSVYGTVDSVTYAAPNTTVVMTMDGDVLTANLSRVSLGPDPTGKPISGTSINQDLSGYPTLAGDNVFDGNITFNGTVTGIIDDVIPEQTSNSGKVLSTDGADMSWVDTPQTPTGSIFWKASTTVPAGFLECDGAEVSRATYSDLYADIGDAFGAGDGATTFNLPDLRGEFVRGWDHGKNVDTGRVLGSAQSYSTEDMYAQVSSADSVVDFNNIPTPNWTANRGDSDGTFAQTQAETTGTKVDVLGTGETRPRNIALMAIIKT